MLQVIFQLHGNLLAFVPFLFPAFARKAFCCMPAKGQKALQNMPDKTVFGRIKRLGLPEGGDFLGQTFQSGNGLWQADAAGGLSNFADSGGA
jgi:hypothetical protein